MWTWWDSIDKVSKFYTYMQVAIAIFGFSAAMASILSIKASNRISELQAEKEIKTQKRIELTESKNKHLERQLVDLKTAPIDVSRLKGRMIIDGGDAKGE